MRSNMGKGLGMDITSSDPIIHYEPPPGMAGTVKSIKDFLEDFDGDLIFRQQFLGLGLGNPSWTNNALRIVVARGLLVRVSLGIYLKTYPVHSGSDVKGAQRAPRLSLLDAGIQVLSRMGIEARPVAGGGLPVLALKLPVDMDIHGIRKISMDGRRIVYVRDRELREKTASAGTPAVDFANAPAATTGAPACAY